MNNKAQFTSGPRIERTPGNWTVQHNNNDDTTYIVANDPRLGADMVAEIYRVSAYEGNANLIAAAPVMYADLCAVRDYLFELYDEGNAKAGEYAASLGITIEQAEGQHHE